VQIEQGGGLLGVEYVAEPEAVIPRQDAYVVVAGVKDLDDAGVGEAPSQGGDVDVR